MFLYNPGNNLLELQNLEAFVAGLVPEDFEKLFGHGSGEVRFRTPGVYVTVSRKRRQFTHDRTQMGRATRLPTALVLPGGLVAVRRSHGWQMYDPRSHTYLPGTYPEPPVVPAKLKLPFVFLRQYGRNVLLNCLTGAKYPMLGKVTFVWSCHMLLEHGALRALYDLRTMSSIRVRELANLTPRFISVKNGGDTYLFDTEAGELHRVDEIVVSEAKLSCYLLLNYGKVIGRVQGTYLDWVHAPSPSVRH